MEYNKASIKVLQKTHPSYKSRGEYFSVIDDLIEGGDRIWKKRSKYLPLIPGEEPEVYNKRLSKFTYEPIIGSSISELERKFETSTISVIGIPDINDAGNVFAQKWANFRENTGSPSDNNIRSEKELATDIFFNLIAYGEVFLHVAKMGDPYIIIHHPSGIINWGMDDTGVWYKLYSEEYRNDPFFSKDILVKKWMFFDGLSIAEYSIKVALENGEPTDIILENGSTVTYDEEYEIDPIVTIHNYGTCPIVSYKIDPKRYVTGKVYLKQLEHLRELNVKHDIITMLYIQRFYKPRVSVEDDLETISEVVQSGIKSGNPYILDVDSFTFAEPTGTASKTVAESLEEIENSIRKSYGLGMRESTKGALERAGISKVLDYVQTKIILEYFGSKTLEVFNIIYPIVSGIMNYPLTSEVSVTGLSNFEISTLESDLSSALMVQDIETSLSPTALKTFFGRISHELAPTATPEEKAIIDNEIQAIFKAAIFINKTDENDVIKSIESSDNEDNQDALR